ncbi:hypothetical protein H8356DRAFT_1329528 [Neocallimastix lanati (nom. inval.)]|nr:hypothetical protein H8356DRAFT_1329528 [Neocallimastix sp. JGI-2020a]
MKDRRRSCSLEGVPLMQREDRGFDPRQEQNIALFNEGKSIKAKNTSLGTRNEETGELSIYFRLKFCLSFRANSKIPRMRGLPISVLNSCSYTAENANYNYIISFNGLKLENLPDVLLGDFNTVANLISDVVPRAF